jgi:nucleoid-associated protein YgaU
MPLLTSSSFGSPDDDASTHERLIPFPARSPRDASRRRREARSRDLERQSTPRRARRRRHQTPWLQRNALSIAALSFLGALLGLGFGLMQVLTRPEQTPALLAVAPSEQATTMVAASVSNLPANPLSAAAAIAPQLREVHAAARVIEPNYTVEAGDTLGRIAGRYNTTVDRILAFNGQISDPRSLRIGSKLVIPPPL